MQPSHEEAAKILDEVSDIARHVQNRVSYGTIGPILIAWGTVWLICCNITHFRPSISGWAWLIGDLIGIACTIYFGWLHPLARAIDSDLERRIGRRLFWFWFLLFIYADFWLMILWPWQSVQLSTFGVTLIMFAYVVMGLWLGLNFMVWLGLGVTILTVATYFIAQVLPGYHSLILGFLAGGPLLVSGLYLLRYYRRSNV